MIIGISGKLGSGKDYITNTIIIPVLEKMINNKGISERFLQYAFADQIKINVMSKYDIKYSDVYEEKTHDSRQLLQNEGSMSRKNDVNIWIKFLSNWIKVHSYRGITNFILSDVRFLNEYNYVKNSGNGIMIKVVAPKRNNERLKQESNGNKQIFDKIKNHISECELDNLSDDKFDLIINNDPEDIYNIKLLQAKFEHIFNEYYIY